MPLSDHQSLFKGRKGKRELVHLLKGEETNVAATEPAAEQAPEAPPPAVEVPSEANPAPLPQVRELKPVKRKAITPAPEPVQPVAVESEAPAFNPRRR